MTASCSCGRRWTGLAQAHCTVCHAHFGSVDGFDRHRTTGRCASPELVRDRNGRPWFKPDDSHFGRTWVRDNPRPHPQMLKRLAALSQDRLTAPDGHTDTPQPPRGAQGATP